MTLYDYRMGRQLESEGYPFYAVIMAAMRQADTENAIKLKSVFPTVWKELEERYHAPDGILPRD